MLLMFGGFSAYFLYDGLAGYPRKNYIVANYKAFNEAGRAWAEERGNWEEFVSKQTIPFDEDRSIYPKDTDFEEPWPSILADREAMDEVSDEGLWKRYAGEKQWPQQVDLDEDPKVAYKIREQFFASGVCAVLVLGTLFFLLRTRARSMKVDEVGYTPPGGERIPYGEMVRIDKRKWETKGLATIYYREGGEEKKVKVDGMVYGQFKEEEGAPAEALFQRILANFEGELIEFVEVDEDELEEDEAGLAEKG